jgi:RNA polymerase sigma-70 factor (ECF subfamily)
MNNFNRNPELLEMIYDMFSDRLYAIALNLTGKEDDAEDIMMHCFEKLWEYKDIESMRMDEIGAFLTQTAKYKIIDNWRKLNSEKEYLKSPEAKLARQYDDVWKFEESMAACNSGLIDIIQKLPDRQGEVLFLFYYEGKSGKEISEVLKISIHTVYHTLQTGRDNLKKILAGLGIK